MKPLLDSSDLSGFPGAPFSDAIVKAAAESVRRDAGWHIAPQVQQTVTVEAQGGTLILPSLHVVNVHSISDGDGNKLGVRVFSLTNGGVLHGDFPSGPLKVVFTHGYSECPAELLPVVAERAHTYQQDHRVSQEQSGAEMIAYAAPSVGRGVPRMLKLYRLPGRL
jgi:hypothetical protein